MELFYNILLETGGMLEKMNRFSDSDFGPYLTMPQSFKFSMSRTLRKKLTSTDEWILDLGIYKRENCKRIFKEALQIKAMSVYLGYNMAPSIMTEIQDSAFMCLKELWISQNQIQSIEMICRMRIPFLEELWLRENNLKATRSLRKSHWPSLKSLSIYGNFLLDIETINELYSPKLSTIWIEYESNEGVQGNELAWIAKIQSSQLSVICIGSQFRIPQPRIQQHLQKRFNQEQLKFYQSED